MALANSTLASVVVCCVAILIPGKKGLPMLRTVLLILLILALVGAIPAWPYSANWGPYPAGGLGLVLVIVLIFVLLGVL